MGRRIGQATCPTCGDFDITDIDLVTVFFGKGLARPYVHIVCELCGMDFAATVSWEAAYIFDTLGCEVVGFSRASAELFTDADIDNFVLRFDFELQEFLNVIDFEDS